MTELALDLAEGLPAPRRAPWRRRRRGASPRQGAAPTRDGRWVKWLRALVALGTLVALGLGTVEGWRWMQRPGVLPLSAVHVQGSATHLSESDVARLLRPFLGQNFVTLDLHAVRGALAANPWVKQVSVHRRWPNTLVVNLTERVPYARWGAEGMVDINGQTFIPQSVPEGDWPQLAGPAGQERRVMEQFARTHKRLAADGLSLEGLELDDRRAWRLHLANGISVNLGRADYDMRVARLLDVYPRVLAPRAQQVAEIDLRYSNGFTVRWQPAEGMPLDAPTERLSARGGNTPTPAG